VREDVVGDVIEHPGHETEAATDVLVWTAQVPLRPGTAAEQAGGLLAVEGLGAEQVRSSDDGADRPE